MKTYNLFRQKSYSHPEYLFATDTTIDGLFAQYLEKVSHYGNPGFKEWSDRITAQFNEDKEAFFVTGYGRLFHRLEIVGKEVFIEAFEVRHDEVLFSVYDSSSAFAIEVDFNTREEAERWCEDNGYTVTG